MPRTNDKDKNKFPPNLYRVGDSWMIDFVFRGQRYRENIGPVSKTVAKETRDRRKTAAADGKLEIGPKVQDILFEKACEKYLEWSQGHVKPNSYDRLVTSSLALKAFFDGKRLSAIAPFSIEKYKLDRKTACACPVVRRRTNGRCSECGHLDRARSGACINRELTMLKTMLKKAVEWDWLGKTPMTTVKFYAEGPGRNRFLTQTEAHTLLSACNPDFRVVVLTAMHSGFRASELRSLRWSSVDMVNRSMTVESCYSKNSETRTVPMTPDVLAAFDELRRDRDCKPEDQVFVRRYGQPWKSWEAAWRNARDRAGLKDFRFHDLRHCYGSWLAMGNVADKGRMELMGHKTPSMSARYAHLSMDYKRDAVAKLPTLGILGSESPQIPPSEEMAKVVGFDK